MKYDKNPCLQHISTNSAMIHYSETAGQHRQKDKDVLVFVHSESSHQEIRKPNILDVNHEAMTSAVKTETQSLNRLSSSHPDRPLCISHEQSVVSSLRVS